MNLTKAEAIKLILGFYVTPAGYWADINYEIPELARFIEAGFTCLDSEDNRKIVPTEQGNQILFSHFEEISRDFIAFMQGKGMECPASEVGDWFVRKYGLSDTDIGEDICVLIANKSYQFGYTSHLPHPARKQDKIILQKV